MPWKNWPLQAEPPLLLFWKNGKNDNSNSKLLSTFNQYWWLLIAEIPRVEHTQEVCCFKCSLLLQRLSWNIWSEVKNWVPRPEGLMSYFLRLRGLTNPHHLHLPGISSHSIGCATMIHKSQLLLQFISYSPMVPTKAAGWPWPDRI